MVAIACGHEDCDDLDVLRHDPALKIACDKRPGRGYRAGLAADALRLENAVSWRMLARMGLGMIDTFCDSYARVPAGSCSTSTTRSIWPMAASSFRCSRPMRATPAFSRS